MKFYFLIHRKLRLRYFLICSFICITSTLFSQPNTQTSNPFSRYGIGELENKGFAQITALGRALSAYENDDRDSINPVFINPGNPASYASLKLTVFEAGGKSNFSFLESSGNKNFQNITYLNYISLAFPVGKKTGFAAGLSPFSNVGYKISDANEVENVGKVTTLYEGDGGLSQVFAGLGWKPFQNNAQRFFRSRFYDSLRVTGNWKKIRTQRFIKNTLSSFSLGANAYLLFGDLYNTASVIYPSTTNYFNVRRVRNTHVSDFYFSYGALISFRIDSTYNRRACLVSNPQGKTTTEYKKECSCKDSLSSADYEKQFPKKLRRRSAWKITLGANIYLPSSLQAEYSAAAYTYKSFSPTVDLIYDTTLNIQRTGNLTMPLIMSYGLGIRKGTRLSILADVSMQNWSYYRFFGEDPGLKNSIRYSLGFQYVKNGDVKRAREVLRQKMMFRGGLYYNSGYLDLKNTRIEEYGVSFGFGFPLGRWVWNHANVSAELGTMGTTSNNLIRTNYARLTLGLTLNQKWFVKRVID